MAAVAVIEAGAQRYETPCGDGTIVWHVWGKGPPVLLLHGGSGSWTHWVRNIDVLIKLGHQVVIPDLPGFGDSVVPPDGRDADVMPRWLEAGVQALVGDQACQVVGFSFGAMVGALMAAAFPSRVARLILVGAPALSNEPSRPVDLRAWSHVPAGAARRAIQRHNLAALMLAREHSIDEFSLSLHVANLERDRLKRRRLARTDIVVRTLPQVTCPVAGIWGEQDAVYRDLIHTIEPALKTAPQYQSLAFLEHTGHWAQFESSAQFNRTLTALLAR